MQTARTCSAFALALCLLAAPFARAARYVVATGGDNANPGTEDKPWKTLAKAAASVAPGDVVCIRAGEYFVGPTWRVNKPGKEGGPITYQAFGDGEVRITPSTIQRREAWTLVKGKIYSTPITDPVLCVFQGALPLHHPGERAKIFSIDEMIPNSFFTDKKTLYVWLEDGSNPRDSVMRAAGNHVVSLYDCHYTVFDGLTVEYGFNGFKDQGKSTHHITIRNCTIRSISSQGIQPVAANCIIEKNLFQKIGTNKYEHGIYCSKPNTIIRQNIFEEISGAGIHQYNQKEPAGGDCEFSGNVFRKPIKMTVRSGRETYYLDIIAWGQGRHRIFNNVFFGDNKRGGVSLNSVDNQVYHNTFVGSTFGIGFHDGKPGNVITNNIILDATRTFVIWPAKAGAQTLDHNLYFNTAAPPRWEHEGGSFKSLDAWRKASDEKQALYADPKLAGPADAHLRQGSPAIDAGAVLKEVPPDIAGTRRPQGGGSDPGAYESSPAKRP